MSALSENPGYLNIPTNLTPLFFRQLFESKSSTYTYLLADVETKDAILIDPCEDTVDRDTNLIKELGLNLVYAINTHCHADHITGTWKLKQRFEGVKSAISVHSGAKADVLLEENQKVYFGSRYLTCLHTPGHTNGCFCYVLDDQSMVFTGDTLLIRGCGRTDFQSGSASTLYNSVHTKLFTLPDHTIVYPAHNYVGRLSSTIAEEKAFNPRLTKPKEQFVDIMHNLNLAYPAQIDRAVPANLNCGFHEEEVKQANEAK